jgi:hypothetical protein
MVPVALCVKLDYRLYYVLINESCPLFQEVLKILGCATGTSVHHGSRPSQSSSFEKISVLKKEKYNGVFRTSFNCQLLDS